MAVQSVGFNPGGGGIPGSLLLRMVLLGGDGVGDDLLLDSGSIYHASFFRLTTIFELLTLFY